MDKSSIIFGNPIDRKTIKKANKSKRKYQKKFGNDSTRDYKLGFKDIDSLDFIDAKNIVLTNESQEFPSDALIVGNIRMGFGHYRISIAMASCAKALGYTPYWLDLASFDSTGSKMIRHQNNLYSTASRISQKSRLFNKFFWEPLNKDGFKKLTYNAVDQKNSELLVPLFRHIPKDIPYIATHVWPAQAAIHAGLTNVVNAIPDNWPMALHLAEGSIHAVQTPYAYLGYKILNGFSKTKLSHIPDDQIKMVGHFVDHELVSNLEGDNLKRLERINNDKPLRILLTVGGAGAGVDLFIKMVEHLIPYVKENKASLFINFGDHLKVYNELKKKIKGLEITEYFNKFNELKHLDEANTGIYAIYNDNIFEAVYATNLLMRISDFMVTKPSELVFYPIPKVFMKHIGGHEVYGALHGAELGDATFEVASAKDLCNMLDTVILDKAVLKSMIERTEVLKKAGFYDGAYECVKLAVKNK